MLKKIFATIGLGAGLIALPSPASAQVSHGFHFRGHPHMAPFGVHFRGGGFGHGFGSGHGFVGRGVHFFAPHPGFRFHRPPHRFRGHFPRRFRGHFGAPPGFFFRGGGFGHGFGHGFGSGHVVVFVGPGCC